MRVAVLGGKLQGVEACYLAKKAGWEIVLADKKVQVPARGLCSEYHCFDFMDTLRLCELLAKVDFVVPALEDIVVLEQIARCAGVTRKRILYDANAYRLSASKIESDSLFAALAVPAPRPWPFCSFPLTVKPSGASGSTGVRRIANAGEMALLEQQVGSLAGFVIQEYLEGPSYSLEIIGLNGEYRSFQVTELEIDAVYDCKRVLAPALLSEELEHEFEQIAKLLAKKLCLNGLMDVEVILHQGKLKVLEIDARLPSQTLTAVYLSTGVNVLEKIWQGEISTDTSKPGNTRGVVYEHIRVTANCLEVCGEHIMTSAQTLNLQPDFFGADEALTNYQPGAAEWVATLLVTAVDRSSAWERCCQVIEKIRSELGISQYRDETPPAILSVTA